MLKLDDFFEIKYKITNFKYFTNSQPIYIFKLSLKS